MRFVTFFPRCENIHLHKDPGRIPHTLGSAFGAQAELYCFENGEFPAMESMHQHLKLCMLPGRPPRNRKPDSRSFAWLRQEAKQIDILHLFHFNWDSVLYGLRYKALHPQGKLYLKLDLDPEAFVRNFPANYPGWWPHKWIDWALRRKFIETCDLISAETPSAEAVFRAKFPHLGKKLVQIPNGVDPEFALGASQVDTVHKRILCVGRHGSHQKNTESLLVALALIEPQDWEVWLVGPAENNFESTLALWCEANPKWATKVHFLGPIQDRQKMGEIFASSALFALPTRHESFGLVYAKALLAGCAIVSTQIPAARELLPESWMAKLCPLEDHQALAQEIEAWRTQDQWMQHRALRQTRGQRYLWTEVLRPLWNRLSGVHQ